MRRRKSWCMSLCVVAGLMTGSLAGCVPGEAEPAEPPEATSEARSALTATFAAGSIIIPLDTTFQDSGALRIYGLVYRLLANNVPVHWAINPAKAQGGTDFTVVAPTLVRDYETNANIGRPIAYRGGPFIIDSADRAAALPIIDEWFLTNVSVVHTVVSGTFTANIERTLTAARGSPCCRMASRRSRSPISRRRASRTRTGTRGRWARPIS